MIFTFIYASMAAFWGGVLAYEWMGTANNAVVAIFVGLEIFMLLGFIHWNSHEA